MKPYVRPELVLVATTLGDTAYVQQPVMCNFSKVIARNKAGNLISGRIIAG